MTCPYKVPKYLSEEDKKNCYATNRGWILLKPNGKYDVVESIAKLDEKIAAWHASQGTEPEAKPIAEEHQLAHDKAAKLTVADISARKAEVDAKLKEIQKELDNANLPVLKDVIKSDTPVKGKPGPKPKLTQAEINEKAGE